jgi:hypothetical protein
MGGFRLQPEGFREVFRLKAEATRSVGDHLTAEATGEGGSIVLIRASADAVQ